MALGRFQLRPSQKNASRLHPCFIRANTGVTLNGNATANIILLKNASPLPGHKNTNFARRVARACRLTQITSFRPFDVLFNQLPIVYELH